MIVTSRYSGSIQASPHPIEIDEDGAWISASWSGETSSESGTTEVSHESSWQSAPVFSREYIGDLEQGRRNLTIVSIYELATALGFGQIERVRPAKK